MARSQLSETIARVKGMAQYVQENLTPDELDLFLDELAPLPEQPEVPAKKTRKKRKAANAQSVAKGKRGLPQDAPVLTDLIASAPSVIRCGVCGNAEDYEDHFKPSPHYHAFAKAA